MRGIPASLHTLLIHPSDSSGPILRAVLNELTTLQGSATAERHESTG